MKYLFEITHPHFVHFYKNIIRILGEENVVITCQDSGIIKQLMESYNISFRIIGTKYYGLFGKFIGQLKYFQKYIRIIKGEKIDTFIGLSPSSMLAAKFSSVPAILFDDDDSAVQPLTKYFTVPFADYIITPKCLAHEKYGNRHLMYAGYQELAYLHPKYFTPDETVLSKYELGKFEYVVLRFNEFKAHHDIGHGGISNLTKKKLIDLLSKRFRVLITTEGQIDADFAVHQMHIDPSDIHHVLAFAFLFSGDSQTMASEAAVLGTPSIRCNTFKGKISYLTELEREYELTFAFHPTEEDEFLKFIETLLKTDNLREVWESRRKVMLNAVEDVNERILYFLDSINKKKL